MLREKQMAIEKSCVGQNQPSLTRIMKQIAPYEENFHGKIVQVGQYVSW